LKTLLETLLRESLDALPESTLPRADRDVRIEVAPSRDPRLGDFASNLAMRLAHIARREPRALAEALAARLPHDPALAKVEVAGSGHINFFLSADCYHADLNRALTLGAAYGKCSSGAGGRIGLVLASNPDACGRQAAYGASLANLLGATGFAVSRETESLLDEGHDGHLLLYICGRGEERRTAAARASLGPQRLEVRVVQPVIGTAEQVSEDARRFFHLLRSHELPLEFDHELARRRSRDNPLFCVQYAHARLCGLPRELAERGFATGVQRGSLARLTLPAERTLLQRVGTFPDAVHEAARRRAPHLIANDLVALAQDLHAYQGAHALVLPDEALRNARLRLAFATQIVIANGLGLLGVSAPDGV
jgi:arginyl-tRNA synthetase